MKAFILTSVLLALPFFTACSQAEKKNTINKQTVRSLNLDRYLGKWYEIARFDHPFERDMVGVTAEYSLTDSLKRRRGRPEGRILMNRVNWRSLFSFGFTASITFWNWTSKITAMF